MHLEKQWPLDFQLFSALGQVIVVILKMNQWMDGSLSLAFFLATSSHCVTLSDNFLKIYFHKIYTYMKIYEFLFIQLYKLIF